MKGKPSSSVIRASPWLLRRVLGWREKAPNVICMVSVGEAVGGLGNWLIMPPKDDELSLICLGSVDTWLGSSTGDVLRPFLERKLRNIDIVRLVVRNAYL